MRSGGRRPFAKAYGLRSVSLSVIALLSIGSGAAVAESMSGALSKAYVFSPDLNQQRASVRAIDEGVPRAAAGWRPMLKFCSSS